MAAPQDHRNARHLRVGRPLAVRPSGQPSLRQSRCWSPPRWGSRRPRRPRPSPSRTLQRTLTTARRWPPWPDNGIFDGTECAEGMLCPGNPMDRKTMAVWTVRALDSQDPGQIPNNRFSDVAADQLPRPLHRTDGRPGRHRRMRRQHKVLPGRHRHPRPDGRVPHPGVQPRPRPRPRLQRRGPRAPRTTTRSPRSPRQQSPQDAATAQPSARAGKPAAPKWPPSSPEPPAS